VHTGIGCLLLGLRHRGVRQSDRGTITGTILDSANALVPNASVTAIHSETGSKYAAVSTGTGNYTLVSLPSGAYDVSVEVPGFKRFVQQGVRVQVAQTARVDIVLQVGSAAESVTVTADAPLLRTESAEQSTTMAGARIEALPMNFAISQGAPYVIPSPLSPWLQARSS